MFAVKASRYLTHMKRLTDLGPGGRGSTSASSRSSGSPKMGPILWQLPANFHRDDERLAAALARSRPAALLEFRHASWFVPEVYELLREQESPS